MYICLRILTLVSLQFICYDIDFSTPAPALWAGGVRNFVLSMEWFNTPVDFSTMAQQAWYVLLLQLHLFLDI